MLPLFIMSSSTIGNQQDYYFSTQQWWWCYSQCWLTSFVDEEDIDDVDDVNDEDDEDDEDEDDNYDEDDNGRGWDKGGENIWHNFSFTHLRVGGLAQNWQLWIDDDFCKANFFSYASSSTLYSCQ